MNRARRIFAGACVLLATAAGCAVVALGGCATDCGNNPCPQNTFSVHSFGRCIVSVDSGCPSTISWFGNVTDCTDGGRRENFALISPTAQDASAPQTCAVRVTLDDGTSVDVSVQFVPHETQCCGTVFDVTPADLELDSPVDASLDVHDDDAD